MISTTAYYLSTDKKSWLKEKCPEQNKNTGSNWDNILMQKNNNTDNNNNYKTKINKIWWLHNLQLWMLP